MDQIQVIKLSGKEVSFIRRNGCIRILGGLKALTEEEKRELFRRIAAITATKNESDQDVMAPDV